MTNKTVEEMAETFAHNLARSVYHFSGKGQYEEGSPEQEAYLDGVSTAVGMMTIDILGGVKSKGLFKPILTTALEQQAREDVEMMKGMKFVPRIGRDKEGKIVDYTTPIEEGHNQALDTLLAHKKQVLGKK